MPNNVEVKARVMNIKELTERARMLSGTEGKLLQQEDTFFVCQNGRLKLRVLQVSINIYLYCHVSSEIYMHMEWGMMLGADGEKTKQKHNFVCQNEWLKQVEGYRKSNYVTQIVCQNGWLKGIAGMEKYTFVCQKGWFKSN